MSMRSDDDKDMDRRLSESKLFIPVALLSMLFLCAGVMAVLIGFAISLAN